MADFIDRLKTGINKGVATVSTGSKNMVEKSKINTCIKNLDDEIKEISGIAGIKLYNYCVANPEGDIPRSEFASFCNEISSRNSQIKQYQAKLAELDAEMDQVRGTSATPTSTQVQCKCGMVNAPGSKFCASCGSPLA